MCTCAGGRVRIRALGSSPSSNEFKLSRAVTKNSRLNEDWLTWKVPINLKSLNGNNYFSFVKTLKCVTIYEGLDFGKLL